VAHPRHARPHATEALTHAQPTPAPSASRPPSATTALPAPTTAARAGAACTNPPRRVAPKGRSATLTADACLGAPATSTPTVATVTSAPCESAVRRVATASSTRSKTTPPAPTDACAAAGYVHALPHAHSVVVTAASIHAVTPIIVVGVRLLVVRVAGAPVAAAPARCRRCGVHAWGAPTSPSTTTTAERVAIPVSRRVVVRRGGVSSHVHRGRTVAMTSVCQRPLRSPVGCVARRVLRPRTAPPPAWDSAPEPRAVCRVDRATTPAARSALRTATR
jgi:hypothetical protein